MSALPPGTRLAVGKDQNSTALIRRLGSGANWCHEDQRDVSRGLGYARPEKANEPTSRSNEMDSTESAPQIALIHNNCDEL